MNPVGITLIFVGMWIAMHAIFSDWGDRLAEAVADA